jgi:hypothetical protein
MAKELLPVQMFWTGRPLGPIERTSMRSFMRCGHAVHLYTYDRTLRVPPGVVTFDAADIMTDIDVYTYPNGSASAFSNDFRFALLLRRGGVWVDADVVCVRPMPWLSRPDIVFAGERADDGSTIPTTHLLKMPAGSMVAHTCVELQHTNRAAVLAGQMKWGAGPKTVGAVVKRLRLGHCVLPWRRTSTCPPEAYHTLLGRASARTTIYPTTMKAVGADTDMIHLWHEMWRRDQTLGPDTVDRLPATSIFAKLRTTLDDPPPPPSKSTDGT